MGSFKGPRTGLITCDCSHGEPAPYAGSSFALGGQRNPSHGYAYVWVQHHRRKTGKSSLSWGERKNACRSLRHIWRSWGRCIFMWAGPLQQIGLSYCINALAAVNSVAVAESLAVCKKANVDLEHFYQVVKNGGGMALFDLFRSPSS
jgi:hypothetical protein